MADTIIPSRRTSAVESPATNLQALFTTLGICTALLPPAGFIVRFVTYSAGLSIAAPERLALAAPLGDLAFTGAAALWFAPLLAVVILTATSLAASVATVHTSLQSARTSIDEFGRMVPLYDERIAPKLSELRRSLFTARTPADVERLEGHITEVEREWEEYKHQVEKVGATSRAAIEEAKQHVEDFASRTGERPTSRIFRWLVYIAMGIAFLVTVVLTAAVTLFSTPGNVLSIVSFFVVAATLFYQLNRRRRVSLVRVVAMFAFVLSVAAVGGGLDDRSAGEVSGVYSFALGPGVPKNGRYVQLGHTDQLVYLNPCGSDRVVGVELSQIWAVQLDKNGSQPPRPYLLQILRDHSKPVLGYRHVC